MNHLFFLVVFVHAAMAIVVLHPSESELSPSAVQVVADKAHEKAISIPGICAVIVGDPGRGTVGTGIFVYSTADTGYVLTTAHGLDGQKPAAVHLSFNQDIRDGLRMQVSGVHIHPKFQPSNALFVHNIALLEFPLNDSWKKIMPVPMDTRNDYEPGVFYEGLIAGYGHFATNKSDLYAIGRAHAGATWVQIHPIESGSPLFMSLLPHRGHQRDSQDKPIVPLALNQYVDIRKPVYVEFELASAAIRVHAEQSMILHGDMGGPLFLKSTTGKLKIAGIARSVTFSDTTLLADKHFYSLMTYWEPVCLYKDWIRSVLFSRKR